MYFAFRLYVYTIQNTKRCGWGHGWGAEQSLREAETEETEGEKEWNSIYKFLVEQVIFE